MDKSGSSNISSALKTFSSKDFGIGSSQCPARGGKDNTEKRKVCESICAIPQKKASYYCKDCPGFDVLWVSGNGNENGNGGGNGVDISDEKILDLKRSSEGFMDLHPEARTFFCPVLDDEVIMAFCKSQRVNPKHCAKQHCDVMSPGTESDDDLSSADVEDNSPVDVKDSSDKKDFPRGSPAGDSVTQKPTVPVRKKTAIRQDAVSGSGTGLKLEKVHCLKKNDSISIYDCEIQSSDNSTQRDYCSLYKCPSKWRVCPVCVRRNYPPIAKAAGKTDFYSVDPESGYCLDHKKYGQDFVKGTEPLKKSLRSRNYSQEQKPQTQSEENDMSTGRPILPRDLLKIGKDAEELMGDGKLNKKKAAKSLEVSETSVNRALVIVSLCEGATNIFLKGAISAGRMIQLEGLSEKAQIDFADKLAAAIGNMGELQKVEKAIAAKRKEEGVVKKPKRVNNHRGRTANHSSSSNSSSSSSPTGDDLAGSANKDPNTAVADDASNSMVAVIDLINSSVGSIIIPPCNGSSKAVHDAAEELKAQAVKRVSDLLQGDEKLGVIMGGLKGLVGVIGLSSEDQSAD